jgi:hypothetical protein
MRWTKLVARMQEKKVAYIFGGEKLRERVRLEDLGLDGRMIFKWIWLMDWINLFQDMGRCHALKSLSLTESV